MIKYQCLDMSKCPACKLLCTKLHSSGVACWAPAACLHQPPGCGAPETCMLWRAAALFGVKKAPAETILTVPLLVLSAAFVVVCRRLFSKPQGIMSLRTAADVDHIEQVGTPKVYQQVLVPHDWPNEL